MTRRSEIIKEIMKECAMGATIKEIGPQITVRTMEIVPLSSRPITEDALSGFKITFHALVNILTCEKSKFPLRFRPVDLNELLVWNESSNGGSGFFNLKENIFHCVSLKWYNLIKAEGLEAETREEFSYKDVLFYD